MSPASRLQGSRAATGLALRTLPGAHLTRMRSAQAQAGARVSEVTCSRLPENSNGDNWAGGGGGVSFVCV